MTSSVSSKTGAFSGVVGQRRNFVNVPALLLGAVILAIWIVIIQMGFVSTQVFPGPLAVATSFVGLTVSSTFWGAFLATLSTWLLALAIAAVLAVVIGVLIGSSPLVHRLMTGLIEFFRPIPSIAILPLILLLFGPTDFTKILLTTYTAFWPMLVQTIYGVLGTDPVLKDVAATLNVRRLEMRRRITLPSALPSMAVGFRISASISLVLCVTLEIIVGMNGLGKEIFLAQSVGSVDRMYALIIVTGLLGWALNALFQRLERRALHWHIANTNRGE